MVDETHMPRVKNVLQKQLKAVRQLTHVPVDGEACGRDSTRFSLSGAATEAVIDGERNSSGCGSRGGSLLRPDPEHAGLVGQRDGAEEGRYVWWGICGRQCTMVGMTAQAQGCDKAQATGSVPTPGNTPHPTLTCTG